jgi:hypothetical protein
MLYTQAKSYTSLYVGKNDIFKFEKLLNDAFAKSFEHAEEIRKSEGRTFYSGSGNVKAMIKCSDKSSLTIKYDFDAPDPAFISDQSDFLDKKVNEISLDFSSRQNNSKIEISISEGRYNDAVNVEVASEDKDFLKLYFAKITETIELMRTRDDFAVRHPAVVGWTFIIIATQGFNYIFSGGLWLLARIFDGDEGHIGELHPLLFYIPAHHIGVHVILCFFSFLFAGNTYFSFARGYINSLYPSIEFDFVPEYHRLALRKRKIANYLLAAIVIPIVIGVVVNIIT